MTGSKTSLYYNSFRDITTFTVYVGLR